jgi:pimeloyl-ACP methyl ester carboxylesterase
LAVSERQVRVHGLFAVVIDSRRARPAVLIHGLGVAGASVLPAARALAARGRPVLVPDLPGFGRSPGPGRVLDVDELAEALGAWVGSSLPAPAHLIGNSFGSQVAVEVAVARPDVVQSLLLLAPTFDTAVRSPLVHLVRALRAGFHESPGLTSAGRRDYARAGPRRLLRTLDLGVRHPVERRLPLVDAPALVVRGERDPIAPAAWSERVAELVGARVATIPGGWHAVAYSMPDAVAALAEAFFADVDGV